MMTADPTGHAEQELDARAGDRDRTLAELEEERDDLSRQQADIAQQRADLRRQRAELRKRAAGPAHRWSDDAVASGRFASMLAQVLPEQEAEPPKERRPYQGARRIAQWAVAASDLTAPQRVLIQRLLLRQSATLETPATVSDARLASDAGMHVRTARRHLVRMGSWISTAPASEHVPLGRVVTPPPGALDAGKGERRRWRPDKGPPTGAHQHAHQHWMDEHLSPLLHGAVRWLWERLDLRPLGLTPTEIGVAHVVALLSDVHGRSVRRTRIVDGSRDLLARHADFPQVPEIAALAGCDPEWARRALHLLDGSGLLRLAAYRGYRAGVEWGLRIPDALMDDPVVTETERSLVSR
jgi:hypothetical protein